MAYLTYSEYIDLGYAEVPQDEFDRLLIRASDSVDGITGHFYRFNNIEDDVPFRRELFKKAVAAQIEYFYEMGSVNSHGIDTPQSVTIGRTSMSYGGRNSSSSEDTSRLISPDVLFLLRDTGLLYAGIGVR